MGMLWQKGGERNCKEITITKNKKGQESGENHDRLRPQATRYIDE